MKKAISLISVSILMFFLTIGTVTAKGTEVNKDFESEMTKAYLHVINEIIDDYGISKEQTLYAWPEAEGKGLRFAKLIDFNIDGKEELLCIYNTTGIYDDFVCKVWGFNGDEAYLLHENVEVHYNDIDGREYQIRYPFVTVSANGGEIGITTVEGKVYLYYINTNAAGPVEHWGDEVYYTLNNGEFKKEAYFDFLAYDYNDDDVLGGYDIKKDSFRKDGKEIGKKKYEQLRSVFEKDAKAIISDYANFEDYDYDTERIETFNLEGFIKTLKEKEILARPTNSKILINNKEVSFEAYTINNHTYFRLRDLAKAVKDTKKQFDIGWNSNAKVIELTSGKPYSVVAGDHVKGYGNVERPSLTNSKLYIDEVEQTLGAYLIDHNNYFKLRDIAQAFDIEIGFDERTKTISINSN